MTVVVVGTHTSIKGTSLYVKQLNVLNFQSASLHHSLPNVCTLFPSLVQATRQSDTCTDWQGGGGTLIYLYIYVGSGHFMGVQIVNFSILIYFL